jgi:hypothetical protein
MGHESNPSEGTKGDFEHRVMLSSVQRLRIVHLFDD